MNALNVVTEGMLYLLVAVVCLILGYIIGTAKSMATIDYLRHELNQLSRDLIFKSNNDNGNVKD